MNFSTELERSLKHFGIFFFLGIVTMLFEDFTKFST